VPIGLYARWIIGSYVTDNRCLIRKFNTDLFEAFLKVIGPTNLAVVTGFYEINKPSGVFIWLDSSVDDGCSTFGNIAAMSARPLSPLVRLASASIMSGRLTRDSGPLGKHDLSGRLSTVKSSHPPYLGQNMVAHVRLGRSQCGDWTNLRNREHQNPGHSNLGPGTSEKPAIVSIA